MDSRLAEHFALATTAADAHWLKRSTLERPAGINPWSLPGTYVASLDFIKRPEALRPLEEVAWDLVVVDEAHAAAWRPTGARRLMRLPVARSACCS